MKGIRLTSFTRDLVIVYWKRKGVNLLEDFKIDLRYLQLVRKSDEHNLILKDPSDESPDLPLHATMMGFYNDELFLSMDNLILGMSYYRKRTESDPLPIVKSKYPYTNTLRNYLNESHGTLELPPHYHYDDHFLKYGERTYTFRVKQNVWRNDYGTSLDRNESFKIFPLIIDFNFMHFGIKMEMHGLKIEWFDNLFYYRSKQDEKILNDLLKYPNHPEFEPVYAIRRNRRSEIDMWDPVKDVVRVEKILGNISFLSEFGYICTMSNYDLLVGDLLEQRKHLLLI